MRMIRAFITGFLPALVGFSRSHARSSYVRLRALGNTKTDLTLRVGRLHYSLRLTLSAQFR
jgi:hypothetical protein